MPEIHKMKLPKEGILGHLEKRELLDAFDPHKEIESALNAGRRVRVTVSRATPFLRTTRGGTLAEPAEKPKVDAITERLFQADSGKDPEYVKSILLGSKVERPFIKLYNDLENRFGTKEFKMQGILANIPGASRRDTQNPHVGTFEDYPDHDPTNVFSGAKRTQHAFEGDLAKTVMDFLKGPDSPERKHLMESLDIGEETLSHPDANLENTIRQRMGTRLARLIDRKLSPEHIVLNISFTDEEGKERHKVIHIAEGILEHMIDRIGGRPTLRGDQRIEYSFPDIFMLPKKPTGEESGAMNPFSEFTFEAHGEEETTVGGALPSPVSTGGTGGALPTPVSTGGTGGALPTPVSTGSTVGTLPTPVDTGDTGGALPTPVDTGDTGGALPTPVDTGDTEETEEGGPPGDIAPRRGIVTKAYVGGGGGPMILAGGELRAGACGGGAIIFLLVGTAVSILLSRL